MNTTQEIIEKTNSLLVPTYNAQPIVLDRGEGAYMYDTEGKKYLDFAVGIAVASLGHANPKILETLKTQAERVMICQASYMTKEKLKAATLITENSCFERVFFCNSGTESVEASLKCARKWAHENKGEDCHEIIAFRKSFHGRTYGAASVTEKRHTQAFFSPYLPGVHFAEFNNIDSVKALASDKTAAIIIEPVQGEGGLTPADPEFLRALRTLCDEQKICLIFDEVQAGFGRLGTLNAYESFTYGEDPSGKPAPVEPDIACWAKGMGGGFPVGAMGTKGVFSKTIVVGTHGTTYGGNPLACAVVATVIEEMLQDGFLDNVQSVSKTLFSGLEKIQRDSNKITDIRGKGLMIGIDTVFDIKDLLKKLQENGLLATQAGKSTLRLTPPLIIGKEHAEEALEIIEKTLKEMD